MNLEKNQRLFLGSFLTLVAAGVGFSARAAVLGLWGAEYGFTKAELGVITRFGLTGFGLTVIFFSVLVERWGYGFLLALTFGFHLLSGVITLLAGPVFHAFGKEAAFWCLSLGTTIFALGNGASEAAINPLIAVLHPQERTHRLNILHAGWPDTRSFAGRGAPKPALGSHPADLPCPDVSLWLFALRPKIPRLTSKSA